VCPGFYPGIVTFEDGSSIVLGALDSYIFARKLDEYGYYQWPPVQIHYNDSSFITQGVPGLGRTWGGWISDGDGGVILFWYDHRGAHKDGFGIWRSNAIYAQRVDRFGTVLWAPGGVRAQGAETGWKLAGITGDGQEGCVIAWSESEFGFPGAQNRERTKIQRISSTGSILWERVLDSSSTQYTLGYSNIVRAEDRLFFLASTGARILALDGTVITQTPLAGLGLLISEKDSVLYSAINVASDTILQTKLTATLDTIWTAYSSGGGGSSTLLHNPVVPDGVGGVYYLRTRIDTSIFVRIRRVDGRGEVWLNELLVRGTDIPTGGFEGHGGIMFGNSSGKVWRYDSLAQPAWQVNPITILINAGEAYFPLLAADNNGGMIMVFWTTFGGVFAHHSGRNGQIGIITKVNDNDFTPGSFTLEQNFPNPFNSSTIISYTVPKQAIVQMEVFDMLGRKIAAAVNDMHSPGKHSVTIHASSWASGIYFYRLKVDGYTVKARKMTLVK
jgi:hypothetical protein